MLGIPGLDPFGFAHALIGVTALILGLALLVRRKGTPVHRRIGLGYVLSMLLLNATALMIYDLYGRFGPFHVASVISLATVAAGFVPVYLRRPRAAWMELHATFMCWSYVGLVAAFISEIAVRVPGIGFGPAVIATTLGVVAGGALLIHTRVPKIVAAFNVGGLTGAAPVGAGGKNG
jgi:uncharacterized membrane protein